MPATKKTKKTENTKKSTSKTKKNTIQTVQFPNMDRFDSINSDEVAIGSNNLDMLMDVSIQLSVELGRTELPVKDVLNIHEGIIVPLDKFAGEPLDLYVNNKLFARGEVVVIEENFGVRITKIISEQNRVLDTLD